MSVKENMWESSSEVSSALYKPLEQKVSGDCYDSFRLYNTNGHYNTHNKRKKEKNNNKNQPKTKTTKNKQSQKNWLGLHQQEYFYFILVTNSHSSILKLLWCRHWCPREHPWVGNAAWPKSNKSKASAWDSKIEKDDWRKKTWVGENDFAAWLLVSRLKRKDEIKAPINSNYPI